MRYEATLTDPGRIAVALEFYLDIFPWNPRDAEHAEYVRLHAEYKQRAEAEAERLDAVND